MFVDTSGLLCFHDKSDPRHADAVSYVNAAAKLITHKYVLAEFVPLCRTRGLPRTSVLSFRTDLLHDPMFTVVWVQPNLHRDALNFLKFRLDKTYSLCDAVSFLVMWQRRLTEALTTDHHFTQEGFQRFLQP